MAGEGKKPSIFTIIVIVFTIVLSSIPVANADSLLSDIEGHWVQNEIENIINKGVIKGYPDGTFKPDNNITRAEFTSLLVRAFNLEPGPGKVFIDTSDHWAEEAVKTANYHGLVNGYNYTLFGPDDFITREQMAVMIIGVIKVKPSNKNKIFTENKNKIFTDSARISVWAKEKATKAAEIGLIVGYPNGKFRPKAGVTRAEATAVLTRGIGYMDRETAAIFDTAGIYGLEDDIEIIRTDAVINADGTILQNIVVEGDLTISEKVDNGDIILNNVKVMGTTFIRGGGKGGIYISSGQYNNMIIEGTPENNVNIVTADIKDTNIIVSEKADGEEIILEGTFKDIEIKADNIILSTRGETKINKIKAYIGILGTIFNIEKNTKIKELVLDSAVEVNNAKGTIERIKGSRVSDSNIKNLPEEKKVPAPGNGYTPPTKPKTYTLTLSTDPRGGGTVTGSGSYIEGTEVKITTEASEGYKFINWTIDGKEESRDASFIYTMLADDVILIANFKVIVDKTALQTKVDKVIVLDENDYTEESWIIFKNALNAAQSVLVDEEATYEVINKVLSDLNAATDKLVERSVIYFDELWDAFANTVNTQAQKTDPGEKVTVQFNADEKYINIKIIDSYHAKGITSIAFGTGLNTAILNLLKSEKVIKINSAGYEVETLNKDRNKKSEDDLQEDALDVAFAWLGDNEIDTPMREYLIGETVDFVLCGELDGREFSESYVIHFY